MHQQLSQEAEEEPSIVFSNVVVSLAHGCQWSLAASHILRMHQKLA